MKTKLYYLLLLIAAVLMSGCKSSTEDLIQDEFREYVRNNFDDPKSFKEIVSIEPCDTVSNEKYIALVKKAVDTSQMLEDEIKKSYDYCLSEEFTYKFKKARANGKYQSLTNQYAEGLKGMYQFLNKYEIYRIECNSAMLHFLADTASLPKMNTILYKIKYRSKNGDTLELNEAYAMVDKANEPNNITIRPDEMKKSELPKPILEVLEVLEVNLKLVQKKSESFSKQLESYNKLKVLL